MSKWTDEKATAECDNVTDDTVSRSVFSYDPLSRQTTESQSIAGGSAKDVTYVYDSGGNRVSMCFTATPPRPPMPMTAATVARA